MIREHQYRSDEHNKPCTYTWYQTPCGRPREDHEQVDYKTLAEDDLKTSTIEREDLAMTKRVAYIVYVNLDLTPGVFHTADSALIVLREILTTRIGQYTPMVYLGQYTPAVGQANTSHLETTDNRKAFLLYVDLDDLPGAMHSKESAQHTISRVLRDRIGHYMPLVSLAPDSFQLPGGAQT